MELTNDPAIQHRSPQFKLAGSLTWILTISAIMFIGSILLAGMLIVRLPTDFLIRSSQSSDFPNTRWPVAKIVAWIIRNATGMLFIVVGVIMLITPGQGMLFVFLGLTLLDFPGKQVLFRRMLGQRRILAMINRIRHRANRPPLELPHPHR